MNYESLINDPVVRNEIAQIPHHVEPRLTIRHRRVSGQRKHGFRKLSDQRKEAMMKIISSDNMIADILYNYLKAKDRRAQSVKLRNKAFKDLFDAGYNYFEIATFFRRDRATVCYALRKLTQTPQKQLKTRFYGIR